MIKVGRLEHSITRRFVENQILAASTGFRSDAARDCSSGGQSRLLIEIKITLGSKSLRTPDRQESFETMDWTTAAMTSSEGLPQIDIARGKATN